MLWNQKVQRDGTIPNNITDVIISENEKGKCMLVDFAVSGDRIVAIKEVKMILQ
jgi:hypothetical protein